MYKIIGGDQKEYGPVTFDQVLAWVRDNRANGQTLIQKEGGPWLPLSALPEFASILAEQAAAAPVAPVASGSSPAAPPPSSYPSALPAFGMEAGPDEQRERALRMVQAPGIALLVLGILRVILAVLGAVLGMMRGQPELPPGQLPPEVAEFLQSPMMQFMQSPTFAVVSSVFALFLAGLVIFAAQKMRALESHTLVLVVTVLASIPCLECCGGCLTLPFGIWALVTLMKPEVKSQFR